MMESPSGIKEYDSVTIGSTQQFENMDLWWERKKPSPPGKVPEERGRKRGTSAEGFLLSKI